MMLPFILLSNHKISSYCQIHKLSRLNPFQLKFRIVQILNQMGQKFALGAIEDDGIIYFTTKF